MQRTTSNLSSTISNNDSALQGATLAFRGSPSPSNKNAVSSTIQHGALAAASRAGIGAVAAYKPAVPEKKLGRTNTGDSSYTAGGAALERSSSSRIGTTTPVRTPIDREVSPSFLAATRAASRWKASAQPSSTNGVTRHVKTSPQSSVPSKIDTDETSIPPTNQLVQLFEAKRKADLPKLNTTLKPLETAEQDNILSPTPLRPSLSIRIRAPTIPKEVFPDPVKLKSPPISPFRSPTQLIEQEPAPLLSRPKDEAVATKQDIETKAAPVVPASKVRKRPSSQQTTSRPLSPELAILQPSKLSSQIQASISPPQLPPPRRRRPISVQMKSDDVPTVSQRKSTPPVLPRRLTNVPPNKLKPQLTADSLANAMVASSLASSRVPSPARSIGSNPPSRQLSSKPHSIASFFLLHSPTHSPAPPKLPPPRQYGLRQTLRRSPSTSDNEDTRRNHQHKHGFLLKKHPNKHAEGARRRWRDSMTERERKRYEGVWAANKGTLLQHETSLDSSTEPSDVHGFIVRDIWSRSGLGVRILSEIWELVEAGGRASRDHNRSGVKRRGRLKKDEFVVGMWLVDQCLKGRKLPVEVQESVWGSARGLMSGLRSR